jgi:trigger factor
MKITLDKTENHTSNLTVDIDSAEMEKFIEKARENLGEKAEIPRGSETKDVNVAREKIIEDVIKDTVPLICSQVIKEQKIETDTQPLVKINQKDPLIFEMVVPLKPAVELGDYHNMRVIPESLAVKEEEVGEILEKFRAKFTKYEMINRPVEEGDVITIDIEGNVEGTSFTKKAVTKCQLTQEFTIGIPGLYKAMIGIKKGDEKEFKLKLPEDYADKAIAGKEASFKIKLCDIQAKVLPELNDDFANKVAPGVKTLNLLKERIKKNMEKEREQNAYSRFANKLMDSIISISSFNYSPITVDMKVQNLITDYIQQLEASCKNFMEYEEKRKQVSEDKLKEQLHPIAEKKIKWSLIINNVAEIENINIGNKDIDEQIEMMISNAEEDLKEEQREYLNECQNRQNVYELLKAKVTIKKLVDIVEANNS